MDEMLRDFLRGTEGDALLGQMHRQLDCAMWDILRRARDSAEGASATAYAVGKHDGIDLMINLIKELRKR